MGRITRAMSPVYYLLRRHLLRVVGATRSSILGGLFAKFDHWVRIRCDDGGVTACRHGLTFCLDLGQLLDNTVYFEDVWEPASNNVFSRLVSPGMTVLDIGANVGIHTLTLARMVGESGIVYAIEPTDWAFHKLLINTKLNPRLAPLVRARQIALSDHSAGPTPYKYRAQWKKSGGYIADEEGTTEHLTLWDFWRAEEFQRLDFIKLDVDGFETRILRGGAKLLQKFKPVLLVEMSDFFQKRCGGSGEEMVRILDGLGYEFYHEDLSDIGESLVTLLAKLGEWETTNIVCIPSR